MAKTFKDVVSDYKREQDRLLNDKSKDPEKVEKELESSLYKTLDSLNDIFNQMSREHHEYYETVRSMNKDARHKLFERYLKRSKGSDSKVYDSFTGMMVEKGQESEFQKAYNSAKANDAKPGSYKIGIRNGKNGLGRVEKWVPISSTSLEEAKKEVLSKNPGWIYIQSIEEEKPAKDKQVIDKYTISAMKPDDPKSSRNGFGIYKDGRFVESCESWSEASKRVKELESKETKDLDTAIKSLDAYYDENSGKELRKQDLESMYKKYNGSQVVSELGEYKVGLKNKYSGPGMVDVHVNVKAASIDLAIKEAVKKNPNLSYSTIKVIKEPKIKLIKNIL